MPDAKTTPQKQSSLAGPAQKYRQDVLDAVADLLDGRPDAVPRKMFGHPGFAVGGGKMFACLYGDGLGLKLSEEQARAALERPGIEPFRPYGKQMREWVMMTLPNPAAYADHLDLFEASIAYVAGQATAPQTARGGRRRGSE